MSWKTSIEYRSIQLYATLSRVSFWGMPFTQYHILFPLCRQPPLKEGNSQIESSVQDNPAVPSPCQYTLTTLLNSGLFRVKPCPLPLEYQAASSQARLKSCWALPPWSVPCSGRVWARQGRSSRQWRCSPCYQWPAACRSETTAQQQHEILCTVPVPD
jgi:hypothetical protein